MTKLLKRVALLVSSTTTISSLLIAAVGASIVQLVASPTTVSALDSDTYSWPNAPCEFGSNGGTSCKNPDQTNYPGDMYDWYENGGNSFSGSLCFYGTNSECFDPTWKFEYRNCTDYVAQKINQMFGVNITSSWGNANNWLNYNANTAHYPTDPTSAPQVGDIAVWTGGTFGHVAYVAAVSGSTATFDEYNEYSDGNYTNNLTTANHGTPNGYIHIGTVSPPAPTSPVPWNFETLDGDPNSVGQYDADAGKNPKSIIYNSTLHVFYYDATNGRLRHAWQQGTGSWTFEVLDGLGGNNGRTTDNVGAAMSVTTYNSTLQLFYYDVTAHSLRHAWSDANGWHFETLDTSGDVGSASTTLTYGTSLQLYYPNLSNGDLRHAWSDANGWHFENLDGDSGSVAGSQGKSVTNVGGSLTGMLDANSNIQLFYYSSTSHGLRHAWADASGWHFENLDGGSLGSITGSSDSIGQNPSAVLNGTAIQLFSYNASKGALRHLWTDSTSWHYENLDGKGSTGPDQYDLGLYSTTIMSGTTLQVFYYDSQWGELRHAWSDTSGWHFENLDGLGGSPSGRLGPNMQIGLFPNAVFYNNVPQLFYYDATNGNLRHTWSQ